MTSSPVIASGVTTQAVGTGGALTGEMAGLDGLFAALMGSMTPDMAAPLSGEVPAVAGDGVISVLLGTHVGVKDGAANPADGFANIFMINAPKDLVREDVQLGDAPALTITGEAETLSAFVQHLKDIYQKVVVEGGLTIGELGDAQELAAALVKQGMSEEQAFGVAERIQTMLEILENQQDGQKIDEKTAGSLVAMMLAVMGQQVSVEAEGAVDGEAQAFSLQIVSVEVTEVPIKAAPQAGAMASWQMRVSGDVARDLLGLDANAQPKLEEPVVEPVTTRKVEVTVKADGDASVAVALPDVKTDAVPMVGLQHPAAVTGQAQADAAAQASTVMENVPSASRIAADEKIEAPKGETYYKLQADKQGVETLEAVKPVANAQEQEPLAGQNSQPQTSIAQVAQPAHLTAAGAGFAERVEKIQEMVEKAGVGRQVAVQMQPLLENGGGTVRINLKPVELGQITVEMTVRDGQVHGSISASDPVVMEQLARELHSLRHGLADAGLKLGEQGINLMLNNGANQDHAGQGGRNGQTFAGGGRGAGSDSDGDLATGLAAWVAPDRVLDVNV